MQLSLSHVVFLSENVRVKGREGVMVIRDNIFLLSCPPCSPLCSLHPRPCPRCRLRPPRRRSGPVFLAGFFVTFLAMPQLPHLPLVVSSHDSVLRLFRKPPSPVFLLCSYTLFLFLFPFEEHALVFLFLFPLLGL